MGETEPPLQGKTIVVGGSKGLIGNSIVEKILAAGGRVVGLDSAAKTTCAPARDCFVEFDCDLLRPEDLSDAVAAGVDRFGQIDGGVFAAYPRSARGFEDFGALTPGGLAENLLAHLGSQLLFAQVIAGSPERKNPTSVVFLGSIQGVAAPKFDHYEGTAMSSPIEYTVAKTSLIGAARWLSARLGDKGHRFNVLSPGGVLDKQPVAFQERYKASTLTRGLLDPSEVTSPIIFLLSDQSKFITGQNLVVDDGWSL
jgi:NAD(P)-dependent dehydrogenase (short-subunit alcohol dehydrogenase family)